MWATHKTDIGVVPVSDPVSPSPSLTHSLSLYLSLFTVPISLSL